MAKTWKEIRNMTLALGFEKTKAFEKNRQAYTDAYNWRQSLIAATVGGVLEKIPVEKGTTDLHKAAADINCRFIAVAQTGLVNKKGERQNCWHITDNRFFTLEKDTDGPLWLTVTVLPKPITSESDDDTPCQLPEKWRNIMPYLMANRLYLDDDAAKAGYYWNLYTDMRNEMLAAENPVAATVNPGIDIDRGWL